MIRTLVVVLAVATSFCLAGCNKNDQAGKPGGDSPPKTTPPVSANTTCETDADCTLSCLIPGDCCGEGCDCSRAYTREELSALVDARRAKCDGKKLDCPQYSCPKPTTRSIAVCEAGDCQAKKVSTQCKTDADCVVSCYQPDQCCPQSCSCSNVFHKDELAALEARSGQAKCRCAKVKCDEPTHETVASCQSGFCVGKQVALE